jgi:2-methylisocitrate lyase-like PEP mutase family enzyme
MNKISAREKATKLLALHTAGKLLVLPNVWNPIGARILQAQGYPAVATASAALAASLGFQDGERLSRATLIDFTGRIARSVDVPVTADIESGYGETLEELRATVTQIVAAGAVGINLEDSTAGGDGLRPVADQCQRIAASRAAADALGLHLVINARVDCFLPRRFADKSKVLQELAARAGAYAEAGADCIYPIGPGDEATVRQIRDSVNLPVNIMASPSGASLAALQAMGVNRVSFGPQIFKACLQTFAHIARDLQAGADYSSLNDMISREALHALLPDGSE